MCLTALEFYSGIGGMHCALQQVAPTAVVLDAFDINHEANRCYKHNFGKSPKQVDIERTKAQDLDAYGADMWLLAPPCQPFSRQGMQLGAKDNRSRSFLNILNQIPAMQTPPTYIVLENVVGFETSDMHTLLLECLAAASYNVAEFILSPIQYGIPYRRPRYFCVASKRPLPVTYPAEVQLCRCTPSLLLQLQRQDADEQTLTAAAQQELGSHAMYVQTIREYLGTAQQRQQQHEEINCSGGNSQTPRALQPWCSSNNSRSASSSSSCVQASTVPAGTCEQVAHTWVPDALISRHADVIDVVSADSRSCNCFTKAYGKLVRGAGSLLATVDPAAVDSRWKLVAGTGSLFYEGYSGSLQELHSNNNRGIGSAVPPAACATAATAEAIQCGEEQATSSAVALAAAAAAAGMPSPHAPAAHVECTRGLAGAWRQLNLRYFTPKEIARFHSFPSSFSFPSDMAPRQCYKLLGNSLSVAVVADLLHFLLPGKS